MRLPWIIAEGRAKNGEEVCYNVGDFLTVTDKDRGRSPEKGSLRLMPREGRRGVRLWVRRRLFMRRSREG
jgi:hypothetical protein